MESKTPDDHDPIEPLIPLVRMRVRRRLKDWPHDHVDDVEQTCLLKLLRVVRAPERLARIAKLEAFAQRVIDNAINDAIREHAAARSMILLPHEAEDDCPSLAQTPAVDADPADIAADNEIAAGLHLTPKQRHLFELRRTLGSTAAVAEALDITTQRASERISRLFRTLNAQRRAEAA